MFIISNRRVTFQLPCQMRPFSVQDVRPRSDRNGHTAATVGRPLPKRLRRYLFVRTVALPLILLGRFAGNAEFPCLLGANHTFPLLRSKERRKLRSRRYCQVRPKSKVRREEHLELPNVPKALTAWRVPQSPESTIRKRTRWVGALPSLSRQGQVSRCLGTSSSSRLPTGESS